MNSEAIQHYKNFLLSLGLENHLDNIDESAEHATSLLQNWMSSTHQAPPKITILDAPQPPTWVMVRNIQFYSFCEHHMVPFFGHADIVLLPDQKIAGFGSYARVIDYYARQPQLQERLTTQISEYIFSALAPQALLIRLNARQLCMEMRGRGAGISCTTFAAKGLCENNHEFLSIAQNMLNSTNNLSPSER